MKGRRNHFRIKFNFIFKTEIREFLTVPQYVGATEEWEEGNQTYLYVCKNEIIVP